MKKVVFIISHLGSNSDYLVKILNNNPRCTILSSNQQYDHVESLQFLYKIHKYKNYAGSIHGDHLLFNHSFSCKYLYDICKFIYVIRPPKHSLMKIYSTKKNYNLKTAVSYYRFRLRRICEMAKQTKNAVLVTYDELMDGKAFNVISNYLKLQEPLKHDMIEGEEFENQKIEIQKKILLKTEDCYEKYYYYLSNLELLRP